MIRCAFAMMVLLFACTMSAQTKADSLYSFLYELPEKAEHFTTDQLRQSYLVTAKNEVIKYDANGQELFRYNNNTLGQLAHIDATDPFNLLLFYPQFLTVILLDRTLAQTGEYNLYDFDIVEAYSVGISNDNNLWIYDDREFKIKKINREGEVLINSGNLSLLLGLGLRPDFILERNNSVYVNDPEVGVVEFDIFGTFVQILPLKNLSNFQVVNKQLIYQKENELFAFHLQSLARKKLPLPQKIKKGDQVRIQKDRIYILQDHRLRVYHF